MNLLPLAPEIVVIATAFAVLLLDLLMSRSPEEPSDRDAGKPWLTCVAIAGLCVAGAFVLPALLDGTDAPPAQLFGGRFEVDPLALWLKPIFLTTTAVTLSVHHSFLERRAEFITVMLFTLAGMLFLPSSRDLVTLYVSLELATIPLFALTAWQRDARGGEAGFKYLAMGSMASAFLLYGLGLLYGLTGSTSLAAASSSLAGGTGGPLPLAWFALALVTAGVGFKLTLFPFQFWAPDAYDGAPPVVTAYLSVASKATGLALALQLFYRVFLPLLPHVAFGVAALAAATMTVGNLAAVKQENLKRFMAYSGISQAGYLILGFLGSSGPDAGTMTFYLLVYAVTNLAVFAVLSTHIHHSHREDVASLAGLSQRNPVLALALMLGLFGLAGIPPLAGFVGKFFLFSIAARAGYHWLVALAALNSTVSLYYYLRLVRQMYIEPSPDGSKPIVVTPWLAGGLALTTLGSVVLGIFPAFFEKLGSDGSRWLALIPH